MKFGRFNLARLHQHHAQIVVRLAIARIEQRRRMQSGNSHDGLTLLDVSEALVKSCLGLGRIVPGDRISRELRRWRPRLDCGQPAGLQRALKSVARLCAEQLINVRHLMREGFPGAGRLLPGRGDDCAQGSRQRIVIRLQTDPPGHAGELLFGIDKIAVVMGDETLVGVDILQQVARVFQP